MTALHAPRPDRTPWVPAKASPRPQLRPVPGAGRRMSAIPFAMVVALLLALGMVGLLVLTTVLENQTFTVQEKQGEAEVLADQLAALEARVSEARSVQHLAVTAQDLGLRPNPYAAQLQVPGGDVYGTASAVRGGEIPAVRYLTPEQAQAQLEALDKAEAERVAKLKAKAAAKKQAEAERKAKAEERAAERAAEKKAAEKAAAEKAAAEKAAQRQQERP